MTALTLPRAAVAVPDPVRAGLRDVIPVLVGVTPFGMTIGAAVVESSISDLAGWLAGPVLVAGSAHLAVVTMIDAGAAALAVVVTALVINARLAAYSAALAPIFSSQPRWFRWAAPYLLVDQTFALVMGRHDTSTDPDWLRRYYLAAVVPLWGVWIGAISAGMLLGPVIPASWELWFCVPLMFTGMLTPAVNSRPSLVASAVAGALAVTLFWLPSGAGLVIAALGGSLAGALAEGWRRD